MMLKTVYLAGALVLLAGCDTAEKAVDDAARVTAKATVEKVLTAHLPNTIPQKMVTPYSDCIIDNSNANELFKLSRASITGVEASTIALVTDIIQRPATTTCIAKATTGLLAS
ncbi:hypothetical protein [Lentibacter sp. XHP0401]|jgi:hypothetical protein|uniref:hypothetical protein n=1 Tax=Lentibacter sp. XHP0401 TaxID=2984334 RepID=UPI0021E9485C|nr:hypothetical protein [Lentibacter sp. XHP0401]MCV2894081.1 hypothetical protein [Lentibacter sp. XHP0401]